MRRIFAVVLLVFLFVGAMAQQKDPVMTFTKTSHDFGNLKQENGPASVKFEFTNTGGQPITISNVKSSCGCTTPSWTKAPIPPGGTGYVEAVYDPRNRPGHFSKTVTVYSNAKNSPVTLTITGNVSEKQNPVAESYPQRVGELRIDKIYLNFGNTYNDETKTMTYKVYNPTDKDINIVIEDRYKPAYTTISVEPSLLRPGEKGEITVNYDASKVNDWDYVRGYIYLTLNGQRIYQQRLQVSAIIKERFTEEQKLNPPRIKFEEMSFEFDTINEGEVIEHIFTFKNTGKSDLLIRKTRSSCGCTAVTTTNKPIKPGETGTIKATFNSTHKRNRQVKTITVITNCPEPQYNKVVLKLTGYVIPKQQK